MPGTLSVRKTLVLGMGTTGKEVAEQLAEQLTWQFGSFERASWVRILVMETEKPTSILGDRLIYAGMTTADFAPYRTNPNTAGQEFSFAEWQEGSLIQNVTNIDAGAGNMRMVGRLCLFHRPTYEQLRSRVMADISSLNQLTPQTIADRLGEPGLQVTIQPQTVVYVIGSLCGGTCSGGCADLGYLLDVWSNQSVTRQAIFTLPHPNLSRSEAPRYKKNAYHALVELNHYQLPQNAWRQKLPDHNDPHVIQKPPYDILRVVMPGGPGAAEVQQLNAMIGQYLAAAVGYAGSSIVANDSNAINKMTSTSTIGFMRPLFSTVGIAALEYPGEHIQRALTSRLEAETLKRWLDYQQDNYFKSELRQLGENDFDALLSRMIEQNGTQVDQIMSDGMKQYFQSTPNPRIEEVEQRLQQFEAALTSNGALPAEGTVNVLPTLLPVLERNYRAFLDTIRHNIEEVIRQSLFDLNGGPGFVIQVLEEYSRVLERWAVEAFNLKQKQIQEAVSDKAFLTEALEAARHQIHQINPFGKAQKVKEAWANVQSKLDRYLATEARAQAVKHISDMRLIQQAAEQYRNVSAAYLRRLSRMQTAFQQEQNRLSEEWQRLARSSPEVNGKILFTPDAPGQPGTVSEAYFDLLRQRRWPGEPAVGWSDARKEEEAQKETLPALKPLLDELDKTDGSSIFDPTPGSSSANETIPAEIRRALEARARSYFDALRAQKQVADLVNDPDLASAIQLSEPRLTVAATQLSSLLTGTRGEEPAKQDLAFADLGDEGTVLRPTLENIQRKLSYAMSLQRGQITNSRDPYRILLIRERHGFTFGQMDGVVKKNQYDLTSLGSSDSRDYSFWHTRRDVNWVDPLVPPTRVEQTEEVWLLALLLGSRKDGILEWTPANRGEIDAKGWYQIQGGDYYVYHLEGNADVIGSDMRLPRQFSEAVSRLLIGDYAALRNTLSQRISAYAGKAGYDRLVRVVDEAVKSPSHFGLEGLDRPTAERIARRYYRRSDSLTRAFFEFKTENMDIGRSEFSYLWHRAGDHIEGSSETYLSDAYYCPKCRFALGKEVQDLLNGMFRCPSCNDGERYWPQ